MAYGTDEGLTAYLAANGLTLPVGSPSAAVLRQRGSAYLDAAYEPELQCSARTDPLIQADAWPRTGHVTQSGVSVPGDIVPLPWVTASYRAAWLEASSPGWASGTIDPNRRTKREKADVLEREIFAPSETGGSAKGILGNVDNVIHGMVAPFLCTNRRFFMAVV